MPEHVGLVQKLHVVDGLLVVHPSGHQQPVLEASHGAILPSRRHRRKLAHPTLVLLVPVGQLVRGSFPADVQAPNQDEHPIHRIHGKVNHGGGGKGCPLAYDAVDVVLVHDPVAVHVLAVSAPYVQLVLQKHNLCTEGGEREVRVLFPNEVWHTGCEGGGRSGRSRARGG